MSELSDELESDAAECFNRIEETLQGLIEKGISARMIVASLHNALLAIVAMTAAPDAPEKNH